MDWPTRRPVLRALVLRALVLLPLVPLLLAPVAARAADPLALWKIVDGKCVPHEKADHNPAPGSFDFAPSSSTTRRPAPKSTSLRVSTRVLPFSRTSEGLRSTC